MSAIILNIGQEVTPTQIESHVQDGHTRCDEEILKRSPEYFLGSAVHDTLNGQGLIEEYRVYRKDGLDEIACIVRFGDKLNGHPGIVHGGIISTAIDNTFGWLFTALKYPPSFTANLTVNFRKPVMANTSVKIIAKLDEKKGRKMFMSAVMMSSTDEILVESTALFITMQKEPELIPEVKCIVDLRPMIPESTAE